MKIYTRTGDSGETSLFDGTRVSKSDPRVAACGEVDELNAWIGLAAAGVADQQIQDRLRQIQRDLLAVGATLADPARRIAARVTRAAVAADDTARLEGWIDAFDQELAPLRRFILPGGSQGGAALHVARTVCRRAERAIVDLADPPVDPEVVRYINRLSDLLFTMARAANHRAGVPDVEW